MTKPPVLRKLRVGSAYCRETVVWDINEDEERLERLCTKSSISSHHASRHQQQVLGPGSVPRSNDLSYDLSDVPPESYLHSSCQYPLLLGCRDDCLYR